MIINYKMHAFDIGKLINKCQLYIYNIFYEYTYQIISSQLYLHKIGTYLPHCYSQPLFRADQFSKFWVFFFNIRFDQI